MVGNEMLQWLADDYNDSIIKGTVTNNYNSFSPKIAKVYCSLQRLQCFNVSPKHFIMKRFIFRMKKYISLRKDTSLDIVFKLIKIYNEQTHSIVAC